MKQQVITHLYRRLAGSEMWPRHRGRARKPEAIKALSRSRSRGTDDFGERRNLYQLTSGVESFGRKAPGGHDYRRPAAPRSPGASGRGDRRRTPAAEVVGATGRQAGAQHRTPAVFKSFERISITMRLARLRTRSDIVRRPWQFTCYLLPLLSTHADRQCVNISFTVCLLFVCLYGCGFLRLAASKFALWFMSLWGSKVPLKAQNRKNRPHTRK